MASLKILLGVLDKTKTKKTLREKYLFPLMNSMIDIAIDWCYECRVATIESSEEPIKVNYLKPIVRHSIHRPL